MRSTRTPPTRRRLPEPVDRSAPASIDDAHLLHRAAAGDLDACARFYDRHAPAACSLARHLCGPDALAEQMVDDVFLAVRTLRAHVSSPA